MDATSGESAKRKRDDLDETRRISPDAKKPSTWFTDKRGVFTFTGKGTETDTGTRPKEPDGAGLHAGRDTPSSFGSQTDLTGMEDAIQKKLEEVKKTLEEKTAMTPTDKMERKDRNSLKKEDVISGKALFDYELKDQKGGQVIIKILD